MKFPILIHLLNNKAKHIVLSWEDLPVDHYFKIVQTGFDPNSVEAEIEVEYRWLDEASEEVVEIDQPTQENDEPSIVDSEGDGASVSSEDSSSAGV